MTPNWWLIALQFHFVIGLQIQLGWATIDIITYQAYFMIFNCISFHSFMTDSSIKCSLLSCVEQAFSVSETFSCDKHYFVTMLLDFATVNIIAMHNVVILPAEQHAVHSVKRARSPQRMGDSCENDGCLVHWRVSPNMAHCTGWLQ